MNWPETIEKALRDTYAQYSPARVDRAWLRCQQDQADDRNATAAQMFPQVLIQCSPRRPESNGATWAADIVCTCGTWADDDPGFRIRAAMFEDVETFFGVLARYRSFRDVSPEAFAFIERARASRPDFHLGGFVLGGGDPPSVADDLVAVAPIAATIHFSTDE